VKEQKIIIKKVRKMHEEEEHGGQWKVAYADFVTAMMAFFMLLWLVTMIAPEKRARVAAYFKYFTIYDKTGQSFMEKSSEIFDEAGESAKKVPREFLKEYNVTPAEFTQRIQTTIESKLSDIKDQVLVDTYDGGVRIQLVDKEGKNMFDLGSSQPTPLALRILQAIGDNIRDMPNPVSIEGHTDSLAYQSSHYSNWDLSTERALAARRALERTGLNSERLVKIAGYADTVPLIQGDRRDPRNRRISIILKFSKEDTQTQAMQGIPSSELIAQPGKVLQ